MSQIQIWRRCPLIQSGRVVRRGWAGRAGLGVAKSATQHRRDTHIWFSWEPRARPPCCSTGVDVAPGVEGLRGRSLLWRGHGLRRRCAHSAVVEAVPLRRCRRWPRLRPLG